MEEYPTPLSAWRFLVVVVDDDDRPFGRFSDAAGDAGYVAVTPISGPVAPEYDSPAVTLALALSREARDEEPFHDE